MKTDKVLPHSAEAEEILRVLNHYEDMAAAAEDAEMVFEIMALKERLNLPVARNSAPVN